MAAFPISPRHARMLLEVAAWQQQQSHVQAGGLDRASALLLLQAGTSQAGGGMGGPSAGRALKALPYAVALAAALSVESPFVQADSISVRRVVGAG